MDGEKEASAERGHEKPRFRQKPPKARPPKRNGPPGEWFLQNIVSRYNRNVLSRHDTILGMKRLTLSDYQALAEFRYQIRKFLHFSEQAVQSAGLERGQYQLMLAVKGIPAGIRPRIRELANRMHVQHHSAVELVNRLESGGYVRRERALDDRREVLLALTPKGERVLEELAVHHREELLSAAPDLVSALKKVMGSKELSRRVNGSQKPVAAKKAEPAGPVRRG